MGANFMPRRSYATPPRRPCSENSWRQGTCRRSCCGISIAYRTFSTAFKLNIAAHQPPQYRAFDSAKLQFPYPTYVHIAPGIDYLERAYDDAKYGWYSSETVSDPGGSHHRR